MWVRKIHRGDDDNDDDEKKWVDEDEEKKGRVDIVLQLDVEARRQVLECQLWYHRRLSVYHGYEWRQVQGRQWLCWWSYRSRPSWRGIVLVTECGWRRLGKTVIAQTSWPHLACHHRIWHRWLGGYGLLDRWCTCGISVGQWGYLGRYQPKRMHMRGWRFLSKGCMV